MYEIPREPWQDDLKMSPEVKAQRDKERDEFFAGFDKQLLKLPLPDADGFKAHVTAVLSDVLAELRIMRDSTKGSLAEQVAYELRKRAGSTGAPDAFHEAFLAKPCNLCGKARDWALDGQLQAVCYSCGSTGGAPTRDDGPYDIRACRGHWHVTCSGDDVMVREGDAMDEATARKAADRENREWIASGEAARWEAQQLRAELAALHSAFNVPLTWTPSRGAASRPDSGAVRDWQRDYFKLADAIARDSTGVDDLVAKVRALRDAASRVPSESPADA